MHLPPDFQSLLNKMDTFSLTVGFQLGLANKRQFSNHLWLGESNRSWGREPGASSQGMVPVVTLLLAEWRMEKVDEGMGNGSSVEFRNTSRVVSMDS